MLLLFLPALLALLRVHVLACNENCPDPPVFTPSTLVVKYTDSISIKCVATEDASLHNGLEVAVGDTERDTNSSATWTWWVPSMLEWDTSAVCFYEAKPGLQCCTILPLTVYQPPEQVSISIVNHTGPMFEHEEYTLQCTVREVAPVQNLTVTFYRGRTVLGKVRSKATSRTPVTEMFALSINTTKEDDGTKLWCQAELELGPAGPQDPVIMPSEEVLSTVYYGPYLEGTASPQPITLIKGSPLHLNCSAVGNPQPSYSWTLPSGHSASHNGNVLTVSAVGYEHAGKYVCNVTGNSKAATVEFSVDVQADITPYIIIGVVVGVLLLCAGAIFTFSRYYKHTRMGQYNLKDVFRLHAKHIAVPSDA
ncbi:intercellular adhesion molecule 3 [Salarias fasciatus]|uniref:Ig-like domain-containing protein n=1 Tax=Salarias fasciatus TaxID=181472 RepID=A0A672GBN7_SALFA|nr:intercellular adhesion molecule 3 [Salarias fasciatus]